MDSAKHLQGSFKWDQTTASWGSCYGVGDMQLMEMPFWVSTEPEWALEARAMTCLSAGWAMVASDFATATDMARTRG